MLANGNLNNAKRDARELRHKHREAIMDMSHIYVQELEALLYNNDCIQRVMGLGGGGWLDRCL